MAVAVLDDDPPWAEVYVPQVGHDSRMAYTPPRTAHSRAWFTSIIREWVAS